MSQEKRNMITRFVPTKPRFNIGDKVGKYTIENVYEDKIHRYLCKHKNGWYEVFFEDDLIFNKKIIGTFVENRGGNRF